MAEELGDRCNGHPENVDAALPVLLGLLEHETDIQVLAAIASALGLMWTPRCLGPLLSLATHADGDVRLAATQGLGGAMCEIEDPAGVAALLVLSRDEDAEVRDWATFQIAQLEADSDEIRSALWERVQDTDTDADGEALVGLARRKDSAVRRILAARLKEGNAGNLIVEAAAELGDPALYPLLVRLAERGWKLSDQRPEVLDQALEACRPPDLSG